MKCSARKPKRLEQVQLKGENMFFFVLLVSETWLHLWFCGVFCKGAEAFFCECCKNVKMAFTA